MFKNTLSLTKGSKKKQRHLLYKGIAEQRSGAHPDSCTRTNEAIEQQIIRMKLDDNEFRKAFCSCKEMFIPFQ